MIPSALKCSRSVELVRSASIVGASSCRTRHATFGKLRLFLPPRAYQNDLDKKGQRAKLKTDRL